VNLNLDSVFDANDITRINSIIGPYDIRFNSAFFSTRTPTGMQNATGLK
jgi:hypothetical protein